MKSWARNLLMLDLTFGPYFKVKRSFTGFGELSFRWIQFASVLRCVGLVTIIIFISFKKAHTSDIRPATLSSSFFATLSYFVTNKQTNSPWTWSKLKHMTLGPLQLRRPFMVGFSFQIMQACHWKDHNTFTNFYLKDLTWSDDDNTM